MTGTPQIACKAPCPVEVEAGETGFRRACRQPKVQPFCDGSHNGTALVPVKFTADAGTTASSCG